MEQVMWFFADENHKVVAQTLMGVNEEEQAIDALSLMINKGKYILGYFRSNGTQKIFEGSRQIVG